MPATIFGVAVGNVLQGVPFHFTDDLHAIHEGVWYWKFLSLLNPFALCAGLVSLSMLVMHGAAWLTLKAEGPVQIRAPHRFVGGTDRGWRLHRLGSLAGLRY